MDQLERGAPEPTAAEVSGLANILVGRYRDTLRWAIEDAKQSPEDAEATAESMGRSHLESLKWTPLNEVSWQQLDGAATVDPDAALAVWEAMKAEARAAVSGGVRAADLVTDHYYVMSRARFIAQWGAFFEDVRPNGGIEAALVDSMALAFASYLLWTGWAHSLTVNEARIATQQAKDERRWDPPRVTEVEARREAVEMADRFHRQFLRTVRALKDYRRTGPAVMVGTAGQVNVAQQQVNVT